MHSWMTLTKNLFLLLEGNSPHQFLNWFIYFNIKKNVMNFSVCKSYFRVLAQGFSLIELFNLSMEGYSHARIISVCVSLILLLYYVYLEKGKQVQLKYKVIGCLIIIPYIVFELYSTYADKSWWIDY